jgi:phosphomevalonate kinase
VRATAPGKLFLSGEYAVLDGGIAVVTTVGRRAVATVEAGAPTSSLVVEAVRRRARAMFRSVGAGNGDQPPGVRVDTRGFSVGGAKLGIGSSGAVAASSAAALFEWAGLGIEDNRGRILEVATGAHREAQGGIGSGADVAASVTGGTILFGSDRGAVPVAECGARHVVVWTGRAASTTDLVEAVRRFSRSDPASHASIMDEMRSLASAIADLFEAGSPDDLAPSYHRYGALMERLGRLAGAPIVTPAHAAIRELASRFGGGAKPSGAGGGDAAVAVFADDDGAKAFEGACGERGATVLDLRIHVEGVRAVHCE